MVLDACLDDAEAMSRGEAQRKIEAPPARQRQPDALSFSQEGFKRHCQSRSENETALAAPADVTRRMST